jgi:hypothetical protein
MTKTIEIGGKKLPVKFNMGVFGKLDAAGLNVLKMDESTDVTIEHIVLMGELAVKAGYKSEGKGYDLDDDFFEDNMELEHIAPLMAAMASGANKNAAEGKKASR